MAENEKYVEMVENEKDTEMEGVALPFERMMVLEQ